MISVWVVERGAFSITAHKTRGDVDDFIREET
jgi:hypothetical protein